VYLRIGFTVRTIWPCDCCKLLNRGYAETTACAARLRARGANAWREFEYDPILLVAVLLTER
jgi:hypothetical protein